MPNTKWLYCVPKYPCLLEEIDFSNLKDFNGYSNHSSETIVPIMASILGAEIIEMHITYDKNQDFPDNNVSFDELELNQITNAIHLAKKIKK